MPLPLICFLRLHIFTLFPVLNCILLRTAFGKLMSVNEGMLPLQFFLYTQCKVYKQCCTSVHVTSEQVIPLRPRHLFGEAARLFMLIYLLFIYKFGYLFSVTPQIKFPLVFLSL
jgi:hypothetical protein